MNAPVPSSPEKLELRLQRIARTTADVVWEWDVAGDNVWWSPNFPLVFGHPFEEAPRTSGAWAEYLHPEDRARVVAELEAALAGPDELWGAEYRFRRADGSYADVFDRGHIEREAGKALRVVGAMMDISERKAAEEALRESEARFRALVELSSDWYWEQDEDLRFLPGRQSAQKDAFRAASYVGKTRWEVVGASLDDPAWAAHKALLERREPFQDFEYGRVGGDGVYRWVSISGEPVFDAAGRFRGYRGVGRDITARRQAEAEREKLARAYASLSAVNELVARARSATELLQGACEIAVASGDFLFAVARRVERESATTRLVAFAGVGHPERLKRPLDLRPGSPDAQSLMVRAHLGGRPIVIAGDAIASNTFLGSLAAESGVRAGAAYPLMRNDECIGGLLLCSRDPQAFAGESGALFERMATNLSFGLEALEAAEALRRKDAYFRSLVENLSDAIGATDMDWRYLYAGPSVERILGFKPEELVGRRFGDATAPEKAEAMRRDLAARLERSGEPQIARFEARYKDGGLRIHEVVVSKGTGPEGQPIYVIAGRDVTDRVRAEETLRRFRLALDRSGELIAIVDLETMRYVDANDPLCAALGYSREELLGMHPDEVIPVGRDELRATYERLTRGEDVPAIRSYYRCKDGSRFPYESRRHAVQSADGRWLIVSIARDMRAELAAEEELRKRGEEFRAVAENAPDGIMRFDAGLRCLYANAAIGKTSARPAEWYLGRRLGEFGLPPAVERALGDAVREALSSGETQTLEFVFPGPRGERHYQARLAPERGPDGRPVSVLGISRDMTDRKQFESRIEHLATHDGLTGLPNRALLGDRVEQAIVHAKRSQGALAVLFVDLDQFKLVNDSFGHGAGDALLVEVAGRLRETVREGDTVARLGGDEFVILLTSLTRAGDSALVARKVAEALDRPVALGNSELRVTASIGISLYPDDGDNLDALLQSADAAMYRAKDSGRNSFQYYSAEMGEQARSRVEIEGGLRRALERGELRLHYQPQVDLATGAVNAVEALLRWEHPQRGMVSPAAFIPVAEESGLIVPIGQWVLSEACREAAGWAAAGLDVKVAVNLSARQFWRGSVTEAVRTALAEAGLPAARLELEITESVVARDLQQVMLALEQLRRMGVGIAIDDFGTGYSSLAYLRSLPIKKVKIDKSFIHGIPADREASALVAEIVRLAHVLSLGVVAEGVETPEQARQLRDAGCEAMQGFLFARPMPAPDIAALLRSGRRFVHGG